MQNQMKMAGGDRLERSMHAQSTDGVHALVSRVSLICAAIGLLLSPSIVSAQRISTTSTGMEVLSPAVATLVASDDAIGMSPTKGLGPYKTPVFVLAGDAAKVSGQLSRTPRNGEHVRLWLAARFQKEGGRLQLTFHRADTGEALAPVQIEAGRSPRLVAAVGGAGVDTGMKVPAANAWVSCALDYVVGSTQMLLTVGKYQMPIDLGIGGGHGPLVGAFSLAVSGGDKARVEISGLEAYCVREESLDGLPVFGQIDWEQRLIPHVKLGPKAGISGHGMASLDGQIYLAGGFIPGGDGSDEYGYRSSRWLHRYSPESGLWQKLPDMPARREYGSVAEADGVLYYVGGGIQAKPRYYSTGTVFAFNTRAGDDATWSTLPSMPTPRTHTIAGVVDHQLIVVGGNEYDFDAKGYAPSTMRSVVEILDLRAPESGWRTGAPVPGSPRGWAGTVLAGGKMFIFGGFTFEPLNADGTGRKSVRERRTWAYDVAKDEWTEKAPAPYAAGGWRAVLYQDRYAFLIGGLWKSPQARADRWNSQPLVYDTLKDVWYTLRDSATPPGGVFNDPGLAIIGDTIYVTGAEATAAHYNYLLIGKIVRDQL